MENANFYENEKSVALLQKLGEILKSFLYNPWHMDRADNF